MIIQGIDDRLFLQLISVFIKCQSVVFNRLNNLTHCQALVCLLSMPYHTREGFL